MSQSSSQSNKAPKRDSFHGITTRALGRKKMTQLEKDSQVEAHRQGRSSVELPERRPASPSPSLKSILKDDKQGRFSLTDADREAATDMDSEESSRLSEERWRRKMRDGRLNSLDNSSNNSVLLFNKDDREKRSSSLISASDEIQKRQSTLESIRSATDNITDTACSIVEAHSSESAITESELDRILSQMKRFSKRVSFSDFPEVRSFQPDETPESSYEDVCNLLQQHSPEDE